MRRTRQAVAGALALAMLPASLGAAWALDNQSNGGAPPPPDYGTQGENQDQGPPPSNYQPLSPEQLDQLVAPIALYPDSLVAQVLAASTYPAQLASAQQFIEQGGDYPPEQLAEMANTQPWDPSVKSLVAFPQVVNDLNRNMDWTTQLGNAYYNQPQDVMNAVQGMRQRAYAAGTLRPTPQLGVTYEPGNIVIAPVSPAVVYVPYYDPWVVYGAPVPVYGGYYYGPPRGIAFGAGLAIGFGFGVAIGAFSHFSWGYHNWAPDWRSRAVVFNRTNYISRSMTVINHGYYGHFDRAPQARAYNQAQAARFGGNNRTTINNVTVNRGGNTYNRGGNTIYRGGQTYSRGGNTYNQPGQAPNSAYRGGSQTRVPSSSGQSGQFHRGGYNQPHNTNAGTRAQAVPRGGQFNGRPAAQPQQHSAPRNNHGNGGGGHEDHHH